QPPPGRGEGGSRQMNSPIISEEELALDAVLPEQLPIGNRRRALSPEVALMCGVLEQAVIDMRQHRHARYGWNRRVRFDAYHWVSSRDRSHPFAFINVCEALGLSPRAVRDRLLRTSADTRKSFEDAAA